jgi:small-conductance mechanosensitive channel
MVRVHYRPPAGRNFWAARLPRTNREAIWCGVTDNDEVAGIESIIAHQKCKQNFMRIFWGMVWILIGFLLIKYSFQIVNFFGKVDWAERHLSSGLGGTYFMYKLIGIVVIVFAFLYLFGGFGIITDPITPFFGGIEQ